MPAPRPLDLTAEQVLELTAIRDRSPRPHLREKAAAVLRVAAGDSMRQVALGRLLRPRRPETVAAWIDRYLTMGRAGLEVAPGRGRRKGQKIDDS